jgi:hypothetical protein
MLLSLRFWGFCSGYLSNIYKMSKKKKGGKKAKKGKAASSAASAPEYIYPRVNAIPKDEGWITLKLKSMLWEHGNFSMIIKTDTTIAFIKRKIVDRFGRIKDSSLFAGNTNFPESMIQDVT